ncbi:DUF3800 domain-containing protein [Romboutsia sp. CE17]|uniref:DUF3800 domain-containing protein n=1 Tax=Romboutsia sp. CE17 TaxID=2724150 RepID=UPI001442B715|nr:DUF3800 domain-containing protein [Romboutsia sp. CE17]QJA09073.1 DUF3800 domain-containing protein [Romboutsia sp. CE17]
MHNIYCDESCHLPNDNSDVMVLGAITCSKENKQSIFENIRNIKQKYNVSTWNEIKWTKVSNSKIDMYKELIDYFFQNDDLSFRGLIAKNKSDLDHNRYNDGDYNKWYYKMYFTLLNPLIDYDSYYNIFIDIKDTKGGPRVRQLRTVLCNNIYDSKEEVIKGIYQINSRESEILQLTDLLIGCISYVHRGLYEQNSTKGKDVLVNYLIEKGNINLYQKTSKYEPKFNLFIWNPRGGTSE